MTIFKRIMRDDFSRTLTIEYICTILLWNIRWRISFMITNYLRFQSNITKYFLIFWKNINQFFMLLRRAFNWRPWIFFQCKKKYS